MYELELVLKLPQVSLVTVSLLHFYQNSFLRAITNNLRYLRDVTCRQLRQLLSFCHTQGQCLISKMCLDIIFIAPAAFARWTAGGWNLLRKSGDREPNWPIKTNNNKENEPIIR